MGFLQTYHKDLFKVVPRVAVIDSTYKIPVTYNINPSQVDSVLHAYKKSIINGDTITESNCDSIFKNFVLENDKLRLLIKKVNGKYLVAVNQKPQLIHDTILCYIHDTIPCGGVVVPINDPNRDDRDWIWWLIPLTLGLLILFLFSKWLDKNKG